MFKVDDAGKHNTSGVQHLEGIQDGFLKEIKRLINREPV